MFNINEFKHLGLVYGGARPTLFQFLLNQTPSNSIVLPAGQLTQLQFVCRAASIPPMSVDAVNVPYFGRVVKMAGNRTFQDYEITVMNDEDWSIRTMFESWNNSINSLESNIRDPSLDTENYKANFNVRQFDKTGTIIRSYQMLGAWPSIVSPINLDWDMANQIEVFTVTFSYDYWLPDPGDSIGVDNEYFTEATTPASVGGTQVQGGNLV